MLRNCYRVFVLISLATIGTSCEMPEKIPAHLENNINGNWTLLRELQKKQIKKNGGCPPAKETALECDIESDYFTEVRGVCRLLENSPTCVVFNPEYSKRPLIWPEHKTCVHSHSRRIRYSRRRHPYQSSLEEIVRAKHRATEGVLPENVDLEGNVMTIRECRAFLFVRKAMRGKCIAMGTQQYGCQSNVDNKVILMHPDCAYVREQR